MIFDFSREKGNWGGIKIERVEGRSEMNEAAVKYKKRVEEWGKRRGRVSLWRYVPFGFNEDASGYHSQGEH